MSRTEGTSVQQQLEKVRGYYDVSTKYYVWMWNALNLPEAGLHYGIWNKDIRNRYQAIDYENQVLADLAQIKQGETVLDAGGGVAGSGIWLARNRGVQVIEANIVHSQLLRGVKNAKKAKVTDMLGFGEMDYHRLPLADESVNVVWSLESIEHAYDRRLFINEAYRLLKPGGRMIVAGTFAGEEKPDSEQQRQLEVGFKVAGSFNDFGTAEELVAIMGKTGFKEIESYDITDRVKKSAGDMELMCVATLGLAKWGHRLGYISQTMVMNNEWGTYQNRLFQEKVTAYNIVVGRK